MTHEKRLSDCAEELRDFLATVCELQGRRGPLLVQLPPSLKRDTAQLNDFLAELRLAAQRSRWRVAVEFRHAEWICDQVYELLDRHKAAICLADMPRCPITEPNDVGFVYIRRHGPGGRYRGCYAGRHIAYDAERIQMWLQAGRDVYVYYNNDVEGHAVDNAQQLIESLRS